MEASLPIPSLEELTEELAREKRRSQKRSRAATVICGFFTALAALILIFALWLPTAQIYGNAMAPTLLPGDVIAAVDTGTVAPGDIILFSHNNALQVRRVIAGPGSLVEIDSQGLVTVNGQPLTEPCVSLPNRGQCDISMPYLVPDGCYFVLGDNRAESIDSRSSVMGCVEESRILGRVFLRLWPLPRFSLLLSQ